MARGAQFKQDIINMETAVADAIRTFQRAHKSSQVVSLRLIRYAGTPGFSVEAVIKNTHAKRKNIRLNHLKNDHK